MFLRLQEAMELSQGAKQECMPHDRATTDQGYQIQNDIGYPQSKVYISAMIQPFPKSIKQMKSISRLVNLAISSPWPP
jgi:hypothetical protein